MTIITKVLALIFGFLVISKTYYDFKKKKESVVMFFFWVLTWTAIIIIALFPTLIDQFNSIVGSKSGDSIGTFIGAAFVFAFFVIYRIYRKANQIEQKLRDVIIKLALKDIEE